MTRDNDQSAINPVDVNRYADWMLYDRFPKKVRMALIESDYEYSSQQVWGVFQQAKCDNPFLSDSLVWDLVIHMIPMNDRKLAQIEREEYINLVEEMRFEKAERLTNIFLKSSSAATDRATVPGVQSPHSQGAENGTQTLEAPG